MSAITNGKRDLTPTSVCEMNAAVELIPPMLIFKSNRMNDDFEKGAPPKNIFRCSKNG